MWMNSDTFKNIMVFFGIMDVVLQYETDEIMDRVKGGWLEVRGRLMPVPVSCDERDVRELGVGSWQLHVDRTKFTNPVTIRSCTPEQAELYASIEVPTSDAGHFPYDNAKGRLHYMPTANHEDFMAEALKLRIVDPESGIFKRIGVVNEVVIPHQVDKTPLLLAQGKEIMKAKPVQP
ncbi:hypothetical protein DPSP01_011164 [Paraphaeosphaeria sporulosa]|uniref:Uncharacterized protein n=1 Tax=Paraphaeosphaeria sporulosa TaxID=1460663 RepID=A0A177CJC8_9PLEO|nr:uncharacterized protein CC84DRAFT_1215951 [Paraphaeosphaeria sporulosa]OAG06930.1 hypothetical protein CC84DRAFT_1215951 [Paraphaeosphaeria sporulosa]